MYFSPSGKLPEPVKAQSHLQDLVGMLDDRAVREALQRSLDSSISCHDIMKAKVCVCTGCDRMQQHMRSWIVWSCGLRHWTLGLWGEAAILRQLGSRGRVYSIHVHITCVVCDGTYQILMVHVHVQVYSGTSLIQTPLGQ